MPLVITRLKYRIPVDYDKTVEELAMAGNYFLHGWNFKEITSANFPSSEKGKAEIDLHVVELMEWIGYRQMVNELRMMPTPLRPATLKELLTLGIIYPHVQRIAPVTELGSIYNDDEYPFVVSLYENCKKKRNIELDISRGIPLTAGEFYAAVPI